MSERTVNIFSDSVKKFDWIKADTYYSKNYDIFHVQSSNVEKDDEGSLLGESETKKCRFCGRTFPDVTFDKRAHVFPRCTGNVNLLSAYECDTCNSFFGDTLESEYSNLFNFNHTLYGVSGKKDKIPMLQSNDNKWKIKAVEHPEKEGNLHIMSEEKGSEGLFQNIDFEKKEFTYLGPTITVLPIAVYKCLTKMALAIMPETELENFNETFTWIRQGKHHPIFDKKKHLCRYMELLGIHNKYPLGILLKRKKNSQNGPYMLFVYMYANLMFMIEVPTKQCKYLYDIRKIEPFVVLGNSVAEKIIDLSSCEKIKISGQSRKFNVGDFVELTEEANDIMTKNAYAKLIQHEISKSISKQSIINNEEANKKGDF